MYNNVYRNVCILLYKGRCVMNSKERVRRAIEHKCTDRVPAAFEAVETVTERLLKEYSFNSIDEIYNKYEIDICPVGVDYIGPELPTTFDNKGNKVITTFWGFRETLHSFENEKYATTSYFPLNGCTTIKEIDNYNWPNPDWFDYESIKRKCDKYKDKAIVFGHEGPFQIVTYLKSMDEFFMDMALNQELAEHILKKINDFEMEYYERALMAADGAIDILRLHDDYGTQISLLFSPQMWEQFFKKNTEKLVNLAHKYGAFYQQHSCGAVEPIIPHLIDCGVDVLEPLQKVKGLEPENLKEKYAGKIAFHGGIDTQGLLPNGTPQEVAKEVEKYISLLHNGGGYILMASQGFEPDVSTENIEAIYAVDRN